MKNRAEQRAFNKRQAVLDFVRGSISVGSPEEEADKASARIIDELQKEREEARRKQPFRKRPAAA